MSHGLVESRHCRIWNEKRPREKRQHGDPAVAGMAVLTWLTWLSVSRNVKHIKTLIGPWSWSNLGCQISVTTLFPKPLSCVLWRLRFMVHAVSFIFDYYSWHLRHHCADHVCNIRSHFRETIELNYIIMLNQFWTDVLICHWKLTDIYNYLSYSLCVFHIFSR